MIQEAYVSFETAKLLKEKGFDENTLMVYMSYGDLCKCNRYDSIRNSNYNDITKNLIFEISYEPFVALSIKSFLTALELLKKPVAFNVSHINC